MAAACPLLITSRSRSSQSVTGRRASTTSGHYDKANVRVEIEALDGQVANADRFQQRHRLSGPEWVVQLIEGHDRALRHARKKCLQCHPGWLVQVEIEEEQADHQMWVSRHEFRDGLQR